MFVKGFRISLGFEKNPGELDNDVLIIVIKSDIRNVYNVLDSTSKKSSFIDSCSSESGFIQMSLSRSNIMACLTLKTRASFANP